MLARLTYAQLKKLACAHTVAWNFSMRMQASEHMQHTRDADTS